MRHSERSLCCFLLVLSATLGCKETNDRQGLPATGTETNWLMTCDEDAECGELSCLCGVCTIGCSTDTECPFEGAVCRSIESADGADACEGHPSNPAAGGLCWSESRATPEPTSTDNRSPAAEASSDSEPSSDPNSPAPDTDEEQPPHDAAGPTPDPAPSAPTGSIEGGSPTDAGQPPTSEPDASYDEPITGSGDASTLPTLGGYVLWQAPGGAAGWGPVLELLENGTLRLWRQSFPFTPHETSAWDLALTLTPEENEEIIGRLLAVDYAALPHEDLGFECYPSLYFEAPGIEPLELRSYPSARALRPEMDEVFSWFDDYLSSHAPEHSGPASYCSLE